MVGRPKPQATSYILPEGKRVEINAVFKVELKSNETVLALLEHKSASHAGTVGLFCNCVGTFHFGDKARQHHSLERLQP